MTLLLHLTTMADAPAQPAWLDADEQARLAEISDPARAAQFVAGHCLARELAAQLGGGSASQWRFVVAADGRRRLAHAQHAPLYASISHSRTALAVAVGRVPLGVDVETPGPPRDWLSLARTMCSPDEVRALADTAEPARPAQFLATWTLKEAWAKRSGLGLQRQSARRCTARACDAPEAEAWTWALPEGGTLALAASVGARVVVAGATDEARPWRYLESTD